MQTDEWIGVYRRFLRYIGVGLLVSSIATLANILWLPGSMHSPIFVLTHSLIFGVVVALLIRAFSNDQVPKARGHWSGLLYLLVPVRPAPRHLVVGDYRPDFRTGYSA